MKKENPSRRKMEMLFFLLILLFAPEIIWFIYTGSIGFDFMWELDFRGLFYVAKTISANMSLIVLWLLILTNRERS